MREHSDTTIAKRGVGEGRWRQQTEAHSASRGHDSAARRRQCARGYACGWHTRAGGRNRPRSAKLAACDGREGGFAVGGRVLATDASLTRCWASWAGVVAAQTRSSGSASSVRIGVQRRPRPHANGRMANDGLGFAALVIRPGGCDEATRQRDTDWTAGAAWVRARASGGRPCLGDGRCLLGRKPAAQLAIGQARAGEGNKKSLDAAATLRRSAGLNGQVLQDAGQRERLILLHGN